MAIYTSGRPKKYNPSSGEGNIPPKEPGEYRILDEIGDIIYVGETNNLNRRMNEHIRSGKLEIEVDDEYDGLHYTFDWKQADKDSTSELRREHERQKIKKHKPELNKSSGGEGRPSRK